MWHIARGWAARGWAEVSTTSASIRWIRPSYTYPDESSRVVVYRWEVITFLVVVWTLNDGNIFDCMMRILLALAYPVCCMVVLYVVVLSCDDHQFDWWEQMGEVLVVSKDMVIPLLSHLGWIYLLHDFFRAMAHVSL